MSNMPVYRAKKIDSDEYVEGFYFNICYFKSKHYIKELLNISGFVDGIQNTNNWDYRDVEIDPTTLAIHFEDMLDSEGTRIFASLSKDGKGGDELSFHSDLNLFYNMDREVEYNGEVVSTALYRDGCFTFDWSYGWEGREVSFKKTKVISIQKIKTN